MNMCVCVRNTSSRLFKANSKFFKEHEGGWLPLQTKTSGEVEGDGKCVMAATIIHSHSFPLLSFSSLTLFCMPSAEGLRRH
jgi:hypothetical protein